MSILEDKIKRNRGFFDNKEPSPGHKERFLDKLEQAPELTVKRHRLYPLLKISAVLIILISVVYLATNIINTRQINKALGQRITLPEDISNTLAYYDAQAGAKLKEIDRYAPNQVVADFARKEANDQFQNIDISMASLRKDFAKDPDNEMLKAALINTQKKKVEIVDNIIIQLDFANTKLY
ncbi:MAG: hypothetical protein GXO86_11470 [Chlorobi bacterium]|nr:hypothetical protein [Chlorobiota bacterium]